MTRKRRSPREAHAITMQLADIIRDTFDTDGQIISHEQLAMEHVTRNKSRRADEDVQVYGGPAVVYLRREENYAIVPVTASIFEYNADDPEDEVAVANAVAGLGAGGPRIGWYHPASKDEWVWVYYIGHLGRAGVHAVYHAARQVDNNAHLISDSGRALITDRSIQKSADGTDLLGPPGEQETLLLEERLDGEVA